MSPLQIVLIVVGIIVLYMIIVFNSLIRLRNRIRNAWSQIDVQLKRRFDLIPNLVETVKGYAKHEKETFKMVTEARNLMKDAKSLGDKAKADNMLSGALKSLFAVAEAYPQLKANENFMQLQEELSGTESKIAYARQFYNDQVLKFNTKIQQFPTNIMAAMFKFKEEEFFKTESKEEREPVKVKF
ncbi:LemA family protein [Candidatus Woesearchaeota archaeon]|nr:MAG: LemA family protein [Candidatus Woesearchaeota archaeon]